jgi:allophanate hydrolase subunit 2
MRYANSLVGNALQTPVLELTMTGPRLICESAGKVALAGAQFAARVNNQSVDSRQAIALAAGDELSFEPPTNGRTRVSRRRGCMAGKDVAGKRKCAAHR